MIFPEGMPEAMREAIESQDPAFAAECVQRWVEADPASRAEAFFESDGPRKVHEARLKIEDNVPTSAELEKWGKA